MVLPLLLATLLAHQAPARPAWVEQLPEAPGRLYALGSADLGAHEGQAVGRASDRARLEVVARLRATVKGRTSVATTTIETARDGQKAGAGSRVVSDTVSVAARAEDLPGLVVEQTFADPAARTVYALAYLDLAQANRVLAGRLEQVRQARARLAPEPSRKVLWKCRRLTRDLDRLEDLMGLVALAAPDPGLRAAFQAERAAVDARLDQVAKADLPPVDLARTAMAVRANVDLPFGVESWLKAQIGTCGLQARDLEPDLVLDLVFAGGAKGPEFIWADMDVYSGVTYRMDAKLTLAEAGGVPVTRTVPITLVQVDSPEGMVNQFRRQIERWLPRLLGEFKTEMQ